MSLPKRLWGKRPPGKRFLKDKLVAKLQGDTRKLSVCLICGGATVYPYACQSSGDVDIRGPEPSGRNCWVEWADAHGGKTLFTTHYKLCNARDQGEC